MAAKKKPVHCTAKRSIRAQIGLVKCWVTTAAADIRRNDRIDALDSLRMARKEIDRARKSIMGVLP
jgi:hypothetical protein